MIGKCTRRTFAVWGLVALLALVFGPFLGPLGARAQAPDYVHLIAAPDRSTADRQADKRRDPLPFLEFAGVRPGMKVLDMGAGGGYSTELMARAVAPDGIVYGQNPPDLGEQAKAAFEARLKSPAMKNVVADIRPFDDPIPPGVPECDSTAHLSISLKLQLFLMRIARQRTPKSNSGYCASGTGANTCGAGVTGSPAAET